MDRMKHTVWLLGNGIISSLPSEKGPVNPDEVSRRLRLDYMYSRKDQTHKSLDVVQALLGQLTGATAELDRFLNEVAETVRKKFWIREVTIALLDRTDMKFRYRYQSGLRAENWSEHQKLAYRADEYRSSTYKAREISKRTLLYLAEDNPYAEGEEFTVNRPVMLEARRLSAEDSIEGDYLDVSILGKNNEIVGWIEFSGTASGKIPDATTIKWIELMASMAGVALAMNEGDNAGKTKGATRGARSSP
jgi:hypothetical protein